MKIKELKNAIKYLPDNMEVIIQKDAEGNDASPLDEINLAVYIPKNTWSGDIINDEDEENIPIKNWKFLINH